MKTIRVLLSEELLLKFIQQCNHVHMNVTRGLPRGSRVVGLKRHHTGNFEIQVSVPGSFLGEDESGLFLPELETIVCAFCSDLDSDADADSS